MKTMDYHYKIFNIGESYGSINFALSISI
jgi:hypothetical protein